MISSSSGSARWGVGLVMCLAIAGGTAAVAANGSTGRADHHMASSVHPRISPLLIKRFAVLREARRSVAVSNLPNMIQGMENPNDPSHALGLDVPATEVQQVAGGTVWVVPGSAGACVATRPPGFSDGTVATCGTTASDMNGLEGVMKDPTTGVDTFWGIAPDGVVSVSTRSFSGRVTHAPIGLNAFVITGNHVRTLTFRYVVRGRSHTQTVARLRESRKPRRSGRAA